MPTSFAHDIEQAAGGRVRSMRNFFERKTASEEAVWDLMITKLAEVEPRFQPDFLRYLFQYFQQK